MAQVGNLPDRPPAKTTCPFPMGTMDPRLTYPGQQVFRDLHPFGTRFPGLYPLRVDKFSQQERLEGFATDVKDSTRRFTWKSYLPWRWCYRGAVHRQRLGERMSTAAC